MSRIDKLLAAMRHNPRADWRIEQLRTVADPHSPPTARYEPRDVSSTSRGQADRTGATADQAVYIRKFLAMIEALEADNGNQA